VVVTRNLAPLQGASRGRLVPRVKTGLKPG
jgi:hypothetical protein